MYVQGYVYGGSVDHRVKYSETTAKLQCFFQAKVFVIDKCAPFNLVGRETQQYI